MKKVHMDRSNKGGLHGEGRIYSYRSAHSFVQDMFTEQKM